MNPIEAIDLKFKSGNDVPVQDARITRAEWEAVKRTLMGHSGDASEMVPVLWFLPYSDGSYSTQKEKPSKTGRHSDWLPLYTKPPEAGEKCKCCGGAKVFPADHNFACPECDNN